MAATSICSNATSCVAPGSFDDPKTFQKMLAASGFAIYGRILSVGSDGQLQIQVLESFKGGDGRAVVSATTEQGMGGQGFGVGDERIFMSIRGAITECGTLAASPQMLAFFRAASLQ